MAGSLMDVLASVPQDNRWKLDQEIDFEHKAGNGETTSKHLDMIADFMEEWDGAVADNLGLTEADRIDIRQKYANKPDMQRYISHDSCMTAACACYILLHDNTQYISDEFCNFVCQIEQEGGTEQMDEQTWKESHIHISN